MIEIVLACLLSAGLWEGPEDWQLVSIDVTEPSMNVIYVPDTRNPWERATSESRVTIRISRMVKPGEDIEIPPWCHGAKQSLELTEKPAVPDPRTD